MSPPSVDEVLLEELAQLERSRNIRLGNDPSRPKPEVSRVGLAFSGGGIRSATFNLGLLQGLAKANLLRAFDYLSTVSGGGYIGSWLMAWMHHQKKGIVGIEEELNRQPHTATKAAESAEVRFLRNYSNYLTPRKGLLGADFWSFLASYLRNTLLNQVILVLAILGLLLLPRVAVSFLSSLEELEEWFASLGWQTHPWLEGQSLALAIGLIFGVVATVLVGLNMLWLDHLSKNGQNGQQTCFEAKWFAPAWVVRLFIVVPIIVCSAFFSYAFVWLFREWNISPDVWWSSAVLGCALYSVPWAFACAVRFVFRPKKREAPNRGPSDRCILLTAIPTGFIGGFLFLPFSHVLFKGGSLLGDARTKWDVLTVGPPLLIGIMLLIGVLHIGLMGRELSDAHREWWARLGAYLLLYAAGWLALFWVAIDFPVALGQFLTYEATKHPSLHYPITLSGVLAWIASTVYGVLFGKSAKTSHWIPDAPLGQRTKAYIARLAPYVFILGMLLGLSLLAAKINDAAIGGTGDFFAKPDDMNFTPWPVVACASALLAAAFLSWRVDINQFSVHNLYRNRLVRCYLGASVRDRHEQPFTGFSNDDFPLSKLVIPEGAASAEEGRPLPILNTSLNVVRGKELALQSRKARSFALCPTHSGYTRPLPGQAHLQSVYGETSQAGSLHRDARDGISLGTAMAISGAAASPNMGFYSLPSLSFLMTVFDVRLGWWLGNPEKPRPWKRGSPLFGFRWLVRELLGATSDDSDYVYLSDGGHFENLALYELVRRRCKLIVASDASCDPDYGFGDLRNAVERCRTDFGVEIDIDVSPLKRQPGSVLSTQHYAVGKIHYCPGDASRDGTLIYVKPALLEKDPLDVVSYPKTNPHFPHDTTANQWFDETHFENYRALGEASGVSASQRIKDEMAPILHLR
ncbi:MAG TPA: hypothetical protein VJN92_18875 [Candidatus Acidoferrum sp.]|nr:hypothetical protein [Candidatus Acidoferrum sp.]